MRTPITSHSAPVDLNPSADWRALVDINDRPGAARKLLVTPEGDLPILRTEYIGEQGELHVITDGGHGFYRYPLDGTVTVRNPQTSIAAIRAAARSDA